MQKLELQLEYKTTSGMFDKDVYMKPYAALDLCQSIAGRHAYYLGIGADTLLKDNLGWITARQRIKFFNTPHLFDNLTVITYPHPQKKYEYFREYECYDQNKNLIFRALSLWVILDFNTNRLSNKNVMPEGIYHEGSYFDGIIKPINAKNDGILVNKYQVVKSDIDMYNHLNNAKYIDIIFDTLKIDSKYYDELTISYQSQAKLDDLIDIYKLDKEGTIYLTGFINDNLCFSSEIKLKEKEQ